MFVVSCKSHLNKLEKKKHGVFSIINKTPATYLIYNIYKIMKLNI